MHIIITSFQYVLKFSLTSKMFYALLFVVFLLKQYNAHFLPISLGLSYDSFLCEIMAVNSFYTCHKQNSIEYSLLTRRVQLIRQQKIYSQQKPHTNTDRAHSYSPTYFCLCHAYLIIYCFSNSCTLLSTIVFYKAYVRV